jgi:glycolate oxidase
MLKLKRLLDPNNIMNPGKYLLDRAYQEAERAGGAPGNPEGVPR